MMLSYYAARANLYYLLRQHPDWSHAQLAAALGYSVSWVEKMAQTHTLRTGRRRAVGPRLARSLAGSQDSTR